MQQIPFQYGDQLHYHRMALATPATSKKDQLKSAATNFSSPKGSQRAAGPIKHVQTPTTVTTPITVHPSAFVSPKATVTGSYMITVRAESIVHPFAVLDSSVGPIVLGEGCIIWDGASIGVACDSVVSKSHDLSEGIADEVDATELGKSVVVETQAVVEARAKVEDYAVIEVGSHVGSGSIVKEVRMKLFSLHA